ncbi:hypothetical protein [Exiguobacterium sp. R-39]|uniref:hypothetical protein n=1 Tax=Exiguobacterium sp. R-39 TaxID=3416708 RepID=UPI003CF39B9F
MKSKNYPHPVLRFKSNDELNDDFNKNSNFDAEVSQRVEGLDYHFDYRFQLTDANLESLLAEEKVCFAVKVECSTTRFRQVFKLSELAGSILLSSTKLERMVIMTTFIVAKETIEDYYSQNFNEDYEGTKFKVFTGDILAEGPQFSFDIDKRTDSLAKIPSIFTIIQTNEKKMPEISFEQDRIVVALNEADFNNYKLLRAYHSQYNYLAPLSSSLFILPALVMFLEGIRKDIEKFNDDDRQDFEDYINDKEAYFRWFKVINTNLKNHKIDLFETNETSLYIAQKLIGDPLSQGLKVFEELFPKYQDDEEVSR